MRRGALAVCLTLAAAAVAAEGFLALKGHGGPIMGIAVAPDGTVATASFDNSAGLWREGRPDWREGHEAAVTAVAFGPGGRLVTGSDDFTVRLWDEGPRLLGEHRGKVAAVAVSPDGAWVASASWDGTVGLWPLDGGGEGRTLSPGAAVNAVAFSADGSRLHVGTSGGLLLRYDLDTGGPPLRVAEHGFGINEIAVGAGWIAYGAVDGGTRVIDAVSGAPIADFTLDRRPILSLAHHAATAQLAVGDGHGYIMVVDTRGWRIVRDFRAMREGPVWALAFSPDGGRLYVGGLDDVAYAWPVAMLDSFDPAPGAERAFLRDPATMPNGERQFMRKCSICHALEPGPSRKAGPTLHALFGRRAGTVPGYAYSDTLAGSDIVWTEETVGALFEEGPDHYVPGTKMPMQVIAADGDRADLVAFLRQATAGE